MRLARVPIRWRLTLIFACAATLLVTALGVAVHVLLARELTGHVEDRLRQDAAAIDATGGAPGARVRPDAAALLRAGISFAEIVGRDGRVLASTPVRRTRPLLAPTQLARARRGPVFVRSREVPGVDTPALVLARPLDGGVLVVAGSAAVRDAALRDIDTLLLIGGPLAVLVLSLGAYALAGAALGPVDAMRRAVASVGDPRRPGAVPLPPARDELRALGETMNALLASIADGLAREQVFLARASHELRTPLAILSHELELATACDRSEADVRAAVASALEEAQVLSRVSEDLLLLARADAGEPVLRDVGPLDADDLLLAVRDRFHALEQACGIEVTPSGAVVVGDRVRLEQAVRNLVDNAIRHGGGRVELLAEDREGGHAIVVRDRGPGVPVELADRAFDRFSRGSASGNGLGLAIVRSVARAHGGDATVTNRAGGGFEAAIVLPATTPEPPLPRAAADGGAGHPA